MEYHKCSLTCLGINLRELLRSRYSGCYVMKSPFIFSFLFYVAARQKNSAQTTTGYSQNNVSFLGSVPIYGFYF